MKSASFPWEFLSVALMAAGIGWVAYLLAATLDDPRRFVPDSGGWLVAATLLVTLSFGMGIVIFGFFLNTNAERRYPPRLIAQLHVAGQLLRYLPGRLWGLAYQISTTRETIPAPILARANIDFMVFSMIGSAAAGFALLAFRKPWPWWMALSPLIGGMVLLAAVFLGGANRILLLAGQFLPRRARNICEAIAAGQPTFPRLVRIMVLFSASWAVYLTGWSLLGCVFHSFAGVDFISLCAYYTLASIIGILSVLTPAGLGVREAAFVMLAGGSADRETVAFFAAFGRIWLMAIEIAMVVLISLFFPWKKAGN
jgi:glycosyltransferase 2 family protein